MSTELYNNLRALVFVLQQQALKCSFTCKSTLAMQHLYTVFLRVAEQQCIILFNEELHMILFRNGSCVEFEVVL